VPETGSHEAPAGRSHGSDLLRERLALAFSSGDARLTRLAGAGTSVTFRNLDAVAESVTILLDRDPPLLAGGDEPAEITVELRAEQAARLAIGAFSLPSALITGAAGFRGPVRKYLAVDPVLRGLLARVNDTIGRRPGRAP
jgi:hypothetical protein